MTRVLIADQTHPVLEERLRQAGFDVSVEPDHDYQSLLRAAQGCDALVVRSKVIIDRPFIDALCPSTEHRSLRCIGRVGAGMETIDVDYAENRGIRCLNSPEGNRDAVGEHTVGLLLALLDNIARADAEVRQGLWRREANRGLELGSLTVGIIGFGNMGQAFARRLSGFGCCVIYYDNNPDLQPPTSDLRTPNSPERVSLETLQQEADVVSFHVPLTADTRHYLDDAFVGAMAKPFFLLNTARGAVVDTAALARGLASGKVRGAALDVLEDENMQSDSLLTLNPELLTRNCVFTPHVAGWTVESKYKLAAVLADKIINVLNTPWERRRPAGTNKTEHQTLNTK